MVSLRVILRVSVERLSSPVGSTSSAFTFGRRCSGGHIMEDVCSVGPHTLQVLTHNLFAI